MRSHFAKIVIAGLVLAALSIPIYISCHRAAARKPQPLSASEREAAGRVATRARSEYFETLDWEPSPGDRLTLGPHSLSGEGYPFGLVVWCEEQDAIFAACVVFRRESPTNAKDLLQLGAVSPDAIDRDLPPGVLAVYPLGRMR